MNGYRWFAYDATFGGELCHDDPHEVEADAEECRARLAADGRDVRLVRLELWTHESGEIAWVSDGAVSVGGGSVRLPGESVQ